MICPMLSNSDGGQWDCEKSNCAWWSDCDECAFITIANSLLSILKERLDV